MMQPTSGGSNSIIVCHDIVMTFARPARAVVTSTTGPGSSRRYTRASGKGLAWRISASARAVRWRLGRKDAVRRLARQRALRLSLFDSPRRSARSRRAPEILEARRLLRTGALDALFAERRPRRGNARIRTFRRRHDFSLLRRFAQCARR